MEMLIRRLSSLFLLVASTCLLFVGCTININIGDPAWETTNETTTQSSNTSSGMSEYQSCAKIYITGATTAATGISSADLVVDAEIVAAYAEILHSERIQGQIREAYPDAQYALSLEPVDETEVLALFARGEAPDDLEGICNMAVSLLCEEAQIAGFGCRVLDHAKPAQLVGTG